MNGRRPATAGAFSYGHVGDHRDASAGAGQQWGEYVLIVTLIVLVSLTALWLFDEEIGDILSAIADPIN